MPKSVSELIRGGSDGAHPPESIGTTSCTQSTRASKVNELRMRGEEEEEREIENWGYRFGSAQHTTSPLEPPSVSGYTSAKSNFQWSDQLPTRKCFDSTPAQPLLPPPHPHLQRGTSRTQILIFLSPTPTGRQTGGLTQARHDACISPTWDSRGIYSAAERAAACDAGCTGSLHGPSPCSVAWGRTGWGAPTCNTTWVPECKEGRDARMHVGVFLLSWGSKTLINTTNNITKVDHNITNLALSKNLLSSRLIITKMLGSLYLFCICHSH